MARCYSCKETTGGVDKWIGCETCPSWCHLKCAHLNGVKPDNIKLINWSCDNCYMGLNRVQKDINELKKAMNDMQDQMKKLVEGKMEDVVTELGRVRDVISADSDLTDETCWATVLKKKKKNEKKNLLVVKSTDDKLKVADKKKEVAEALDGTQIVNTRFTQKGDIVMNFEDEKKRDEAAQKLGAVPDVTTKNVRKLKPKIIICNVNKEEESGDKLIENLIDRNDYLQGVTDVKAKMELLFDKPATGGTTHYIIKCDPEIRELIHKNRDQVKLEWGVYSVRDRYWATVCYHCQRFGHTALRCLSKGKGEDPICAKCAGNHNTRDCTSTERKCISCKRFKKTDFEHMANDVRYCSVMQEELQKIKSSTENGY